MAIWPCIDHSLLSPNGHMSKRARTAALTRETARIFEGVDLTPKLPPQPSKRDRLLQEATRCRELASRGMRPRAFIKQAEMCERQAAELAAA